MIDGHKIIDFHIHIGGEEHWKPWVREYQDKMNPEISGKLAEIMTPDGMMEYLEKEGVDYAVILAEYSPITTGIVTTESVIEFCSHSDRFIPFGSINPHLESDVRDTMEKFVNLGIKGIKLYPSYIHIFPNDRRLYPIYEICSREKMPLMVHTGSSIFKGARLKYANPLLLDDVAVDFPDLPILLVHGGRGLWYREAEFLSRLHKNVYLEISGIPPQRIPEYYPELERISDKVIFGSDFPGVPGIRKNIEKILNLPLKDRTKRKILYENAYKLLKRSGALK